MARKKNKKNRGKQKVTQRRERNPDYIVYTDGGCSFNPGGAGGIGVVIVDCKTGETSEISKGYVATTNNRMEILAVMEGLKALPDLCSVWLYSDSQYVLNCMSGIWEQKKNTDLWAKLNQVRKGKSLELNWVRGHNGNPLNERCDELASEGMCLPELETDEGYEAEREAGREFYRNVDEHLNNHPGGAMAVQIDIPDEIIDEPPTISSLKDYAKEHGIHSSCAKAIILFYGQRRHSFKDYLELKTGGIDGCSRKSAVKISKTKENPELYLATIRSYFPNDEKDVNSACRWNARGLTLADSIRKVLVDAEVRSNCLRQAPRLY